MCSVPLNIAKVLRWYDCFCVYLLACHILGALLDLGENGRFLAVVEHAYPDVHTSKGLG